MHYRESLRFQRGEPVKGAIRIRGIRHVLRQWTGHARDDGFPRAFHDARLDHRLGISGMKEEVGAQERPIIFLKE